MLAKRPFNLRALAKRNSRCSRSRGRLQRHHVVADITGTTGLQIIRAILAGERDPNMLARLRDYRCHASAETDREGAHREPQRRAVCTGAGTRPPRRLPREGVGLRRPDRSRIESVVDADQPLPGTDQVNGLAFDVRSALFTLLGKDLTQIDGLGPYLSLKLIAESAATTSQPGRVQSTSLRR